MLTTLAVPAKPGFLLAVAALSAPKEMFSFSMGPLDVFAMVFPPGYVEEARKILRGYLVSLHEGGPIFIHGVGFDCIIYDSPRFVRATARRTHEMPERRQGMEWWTLRWHDTNPLWGMSDEALEQFTQWEKKEYEKVKASEASKENSQS